MKSGTDGPNGPQNWSGKTLTYRAVTDRGRERMRQCCLLP